MKIKPVPAEKLPEYMNYMETCQFLGLGSYNTLYKFIKAGLIVTIVNGTKRISKTNAKKFMEMNATTQN